LLKRSPQFARTPTNLSESINHKLEMYALAGSAAGVGILALSLSAEAKVVYTPTWVEISRHTGIVQLDLNHDGMADFKFSDSATSEASYLPLKVLPGIQQNAIWGGESASALRAGVHIGPKGRFQQVGLIMAAEGAHCSGTCTVFSFGPWVDVTRRYLGLKFSIQGKIHYGWARLNVTVSDGPVAALTGYAYETIANKPIVTGQTKGDADEIGEGHQGDPAVLGMASPPLASLGALARGTRELDIWRKRDAIEKS
jgi:hypothetical protein